MMLVGAIVSLVALVEASSYDCPASSSWIHASAKVTVDTSVECGDVRAEVLSRVNGQFGMWHDPHNNGTYKRDQSGGRTRQ